MWTVIKSIEVKMDTESVELLKDVCEMARRYIRLVNMEMSDWEPEKLTEIRTFIHNAFEL